MGITAVDIVEGLFTAVYWLIFARIILSFVSVFLRIDRYNPVMRFIYDITEPIMAPFRRIIPPVGGMDFSPIVLFLVLQLVRAWILRLIS